jgi:two-component system phosphate regulon response regulator OmpR
MEKASQKASSIPRAYDQEHHILVIDDDTRICDLVARYLDDRGFVVVSAHNADEARTAMAVFEFDALVVDVMMPGETGFEFVDAMRGDGGEIPAVFLTALEDSENRIKGFESGADDYLTKPFEPQELVMRLQAILRRTAKQKTAQSRYKIGQWSFDPGFDELCAGEEVAALTTSETALLRALLQKPNDVMSRDELAQVLCVDAGERTIDVQVTRLRRKIEDDPKRPRVLQTVRGKGYLLRVEVL